MIRRRSVFALIVLFGGVILILAYGGIESSRKNMLRLLRQQGESLMQALITSARNNLASSTIFEEAAIERLLDVAPLLGALVDQNRNYVDSLDAWARRYALERIDIVDRARRITASSWGEKVGDSLGQDGGRINVLDSVLSGRRAIAVAPPLPSALPRDDYTFLALRTAKGVMLLQAKARKLTDYQESLGIGFVVQQLAGQEGVTYVVLQSSTGIVLASHNVQRMVAIEGDPFLLNAVANEEIATRLYEFEGKKVLEVVQAFKSDLLPSGLLRLGLSLDAYEQLYASSLKQLAILSLVLFALGIVGSYAATSTKKLQVARGSLEQLQSLTDEIIEALEAAVVATDPVGRITIFNPQAERLFSKSAKAVVGHTYLSVFKDDLLSLEKVRLEATTVCRFEVTLPRPSGRRLQLLVSSVPIHSRDGSYAGAVSLVYDLTELKRLEESARTAERLSELGTLAAAVAHEIRNPLNAISIAAQRLRLEFQPTANADDYQAFLKTISDEIERLNTIIKDFLALARGGAPQKVLVELRDFLEDIATLARLESQGKKIVTTVDVESGLKAEFDTMEMKKVFLNLIKNAVEAVGATGTIAITARKAPSGRTEIDISNSGKPIPNEDRARIFQPYFTTRRDGTGLGLAICRRIVADHGGTIELLEGTPTTFRIVI